MEADTEEQNDRDRRGSDPSESSKPQWRSLFAFTTRPHLLPLCLALVLSVSSGVVGPVQSYLLGKVFACFTKFGAGKYEGPELIQNVSRYALGITGLGVASGLLHTGYFAFWLVFGELQAKCARDSLFGGMLAKDMEWYDMRKDGIEALIQRLQTYVENIQGLGDLLTFDAGRFVSFKWGHRNPLGSLFKASSPHCQALDLPCILHGILRSSPSLPYPSRLLHLAGYLPECNPASMPKPRS